MTDPCDTESELKVYRFKAVLFGSVSSPFILNAVIKSHLERHPTEVADNLKNNIYVDNVISSVETKDITINNYNESIALLRDAGFKLRSWSTNNKDLQTIISADHNDAGAGPVKVLGLIWENEDDNLSFPSSTFLEQSIYMKRDVVKYASSLFDPLGIVAPVHIKAKIFIQKLWSMNI